MEAVPTTYLPNFEILKESLGKIGKIKLVQGNFSQYSSRYDAFLRGEMPNIFNPDFAGGCLMDINFYNVYLNVALFGMTAKEWRDANPELKGNMRDYATINQLICLSNMENINAVFINEGIPQTDRLHKLNQIAIQQMTVLESIESKKILTK